MATVSDRILERLQQAPAGLDDGELATALDARRPTVNQACRKLADAGKIVRAAGESGRIVNTLLAATPAAGGAPEPTAPEPVAETAPQPVADAEPVTEPVAEAGSEPEPEPVAESTPEPVAAAEPEPTPEPVAQAEPEPAPEPTPEPVAQAEPEPAAEPTPEPVAREEATADNNHLVFDASDDPPPPADAEPALTGARGGDPDASPAPQRRRWWRRIGGRSRG